MQLGFRPKALSVENRIVTEPIDVFETARQKNIEKQNMADSSVKQFYRRPLPDTCISFCSKQGQDVFKEALASGHMQCYFKLASQYRTQDEPAYCGLSTLVMVLNSLEVDPGWWYEISRNLCLLKNVFINTVIGKVKALFRCSNVDQNTNFCCKLVNCIPYRVH